jgi:hypothetical protein
MPMPTAAPPTRPSVLDNIPHTPILFLVAIVSTVAVIVADFWISLTNRTINQANWDKLHDFLPFLFLWAGGTYVGKRATSWKPGVDTPLVETTTETTAAAPPAPALAALTTRSETGKPSASGQPPDMIATPIERGEPTAASLVRPGRAG